MSAYASRGDRWFSALAAGGIPLKDLPGSLRAADADGIRFIAVVPDRNNPYPRARRGEVGLVEGWSLAKIVSETVAEEADRPVKRPIVAIVDVPSQAYGRREEAFGLHQALAGAAGAYAKARMAGHPIVALIVGKAMSGAFLAHGYQANELLALDDKEVLVHAMGKASAARITLRTIEELDRFAAKVPPMAYDIKHFASLGILSRLLKVSNPDAPSTDDVSGVRREIVEAIERARRSGTTLSNRFGSENRRASRMVREMLKAQWYS